MNQPEQLIDDCLHDTLEENGWADLQQWLKADDIQHRTDHWHQGH
jgi:hypothetical protein